MKLRMKKIDKNRNKNSYKNLSKAHTKKKKKGRSGNRTYQNLYIREMGKLNSEYLRLGISYGYNIHHIKKVSDHSHLKNDFDNLLMLEKKEHQFIHESNDSEKIAEILNKALKMKALGIRQADLYKEGNYKISRGYLKGHIDNLTKLAEKDKSYNLILARFKREYNKHNRYNTI